MNKRQRDSLVCLIITIGQGTVMEWTALVVPFVIHYEFSHKMRA